jgi:pyruvate,water dikinase
MATTTVHRRRFPSPYEIKPPEGCEGYEEMYPYYAVFNEERRDLDEERCWILNGMHFPEAMFPFDLLSADQCYVGLGGANTRLFVVPPALGIEHRVLNGYVYMSSNSVVDPNEVERRAQLFLPRAGHYFQHWDELYERWVRKVEEATAELRALEVPDGPGEDPMAAYHRLVELNDLIWQYHFEFLNLGYAAYLTFSQLLRQHFPDITDQSIARMVAGIDVVLFRPDEELKRLARLAIDLGVADELEAGLEDGRGLKDLDRRLSASSAGRAWLDDLSRTMDPWFYFSYGNGMYHHHRSWIDDPALPLATIGTYVRRLRDGEDIGRPLDRLLLERERIAGEYRDMLPDDEARKAFAEALGLARTVFPYVEGHNFYVEHRFQAIWWNKVREFGALLVRHEFLDDPDDVFYLKGSDVADALTDLRLSSARSSPPTGGRHWKPVVARRKQTIERLRKSPPPSALGPAPDTVTEPFTIMLFGVTSEQIDSWLAGQEPGTRTLKGFAGSPGVVEGVARVVLSVDQLDRLQDGEILVAPVTAPSWTPVFGRIRGAVSDIGGIMSHAAIVAREFGLPAVVGTGYGTSTIKTGQRVRVDGDTGLVTILE